MNKFRLFISVAILLIISNKIYSTNFSGTYTIGATGTYTTLTALSNALKSTSGNTVTGNCIFEIKSDYNTTGETFPIVFKQFTGAGSYTVTIRPQSGVTSVLTAGSNTTAIISMDSADNYVFDGRAGGSGSAVWTIRNTRSSSTFGTVIRLLNGATSNTFTYLIVESQNASTSSGNIYFQGTTNTTGNSDNTISYCQIRNRSDVAGTYHIHGIYASGNTTYPNSGNTISNCEFFNHFHATSTTYAIHIAAGNTDYTITDNKIYQPSTLTYTGANYHMGIRVNNSSGNNFTITNNTIGYANASGTGTYTMTSAVNIRYIGIYLTVGTSTATSVQGNKMANISLTTNGNSQSGYGMFSGIYVTAGKVNIGNTSGNIIGDTASNGSITISNSNTTTNLVLANGIASTSTSTCIISNNIIGGITFTNSDATSGICIFGIATAGTSANYTIENNNIGSHGTSNNIQLGINGFTTGPGRFMGIYNAATGTIAINNNRIRSITNYCQGDYYNLAINSSSGVNTITGNAIYNISAYNSRAGNVGSPVIGGIIKSSTEAGTHKVNDNLIYNLYAQHSTANNYITGIYLAGPAANANELNDNTLYNFTIASSGSTATIYGVYIASSGGAAQRNYIHSMSSATSTARILGLQVAGGDMSFYNNRLRIGIDAGGNSITSAVNLWGIYKSSTSANNFYYNTVYLGGTGVGSTTNNTYAFYRSVNTTSDIIQNNILVNNRSNSTTGGKHYCYTFTGTNAATMDYNLYYCNGTDGYVSSLNSGTTGRQTLRLTRENYPGQDLHSAYGDPNFVNATGTSSTLDLNVSGTTPVEGSGISIGGISDDFNADTRASLTPNDLGSDAGNFTLNDVFTPNITYNALSNTNSTSNRSLSNVTITDIGSGVNTTGSYQPAIWYRISSGTPTAWVSKLGTKNSGDGNNGDWTFTLDYGLLSRTPTTGDVIQYYVVAQDQASTPNIWYTPFIGANHSDVLTRVSAPTTPNSYTITGTYLSGTYNVGTGGGSDYPTLTGTGGFFAAANSTSINGNITLQIISDISEPGTYSLNPLTMGGSSYSITIVPSAASVRTLSGSVAAGLIKINGADSIYFDGRYSGSGNYLRIRNTSTSSSAAGITFLNGACYNKVQYCTFEGGSNQSCILFSTASSITGNNYNLIDNNIIRNRTDVSQVPTSGIASTGTGTVGLENRDNTISSNEIFNFLTYGINISSTGNGDNWVVSNNHFYNNLATAPSGSQYPIYFASSVADNCSITGNNIGGQSASCGGSPWTNSGAVNFFPIYISSIGSSTASTIDYNTISNIRLSTTSAAAFTGIYQNGGLLNIGTTNGNLIGSINTSSSIQIDGTGTNYGIRVESGTSTIKKNTVANIAQTYSSVGSISGIYVNVTTAITIEKNKIFKIGPNTAVTTANSIAGIRMATTGTPTGYYIYNNMIALGQNSNSTSQTIFGIYLASSSGGTTKIFNNSIFITGTASASTYRTSCIFRNSSCNINMKNNLLFNERSGSSSYNLAVNFESTSGTIESDYNLMVGSNATYLNKWGSSYYSFSQWKTNSLKDVFSLGESTSTISSANMFFDATDGNLLLKNDDETCWYSNGNGLALSEVATDFEGDARITHYSNGSTDIGADEFDNAETNEPIVATQSGTIAVGNTTTYTLGGRTVATIYWQSGSGLPTSIEVKYFSGQHAELPSDAPMYGHTQITQTGGTSFVYDLTLPFTDALVGLISDPNIMSVAKSSDGITWTDNDATVNYSARTITVQDLTSFSYFNIISYGDLEGSPLPIKLISFDAKNMAETVELSWTTATEENNDYFELERSVDANNWNSIAKMAGAGNANQVNKYNFIDNSPNEGVNYYRLTSHDFNGETHVYSMISVIHNPTDIDIVFDGNAINIIGEFGNDAMIEIFDATGNLVFRNKLSSGNDSVAKIAFDAQSGIYFVRFIDSHDQKVVRFYK